MICSHVGHCFCQSVISTDCSTQCRICFNVILVCLDFYCCWICISELSFDPSMHVLCVLIDIWLHINKGSLLLYKSIIQDGSQLDHWTYRSIIYAVCKILDVVKEGTESLEKHQMLTTEKLHDQCTGWQWML